MVACLRSNFLYTEKRPRDLLFDSLEKMLSEAGDRPPILAKLEREAARLAAQAASRQNIQYSNWGTASRALTNAMLHARVLLGLQDEVVPPGLAARATVVHRLANDFRETTEAYLLLVIIDQLKDVAVRDHTALAHALLRRFDRTVSLGEMEDQIVILLAKLHQQVTLLSDGTYHALSSARTFEPPSKAL